MQTPYFTDMDRVMQAKLKINKTKALRGFFDVILEVDDMIMLTMALFISFYPVVEGWSPIDEAKVPSAIKSKTITVVTKKGIKAINNTKLTVRTATEIIHYRKILNVWFMYKEEVVE